MFAPILAAHSFSRYQFLRGDYATSYQNITPTRGISEADLRRARRGYGSPIHEGTHMLIVGVVCDSGVRRVLHESTLEPLNEFTLEATDVSTVELNP